MSLATTVQTLHANADHARQLLLLRRLALACLLLMAVVVSASAWLRLAPASGACADWPACRNAAGVAVALQAGVAADMEPQASAARAFVRGVHRLAASAVLLVVIALVVLSLRAAPRDPAVLRRAWAMLLLALGLAALGIATPGSHSTVVMLGNLLGGLLLFALAWNLWRALHHDGTVASPALARAALACTLLWLLQAALGARSGAGGSAVAPALHLALAVAAGTGALLVGQAALRAGRRGEGLAVVAVVALQALWGPLTVAWNAPAAAVLVHNAGAAIGIALLFGIAWVPRAPLREMAA